MDEKDIFEDLENIIKDFRRENEAKSLNTSYEEKLEDLKDLRNFSAGKNDEPTYQIIYPRIEDTTTREKIIEKKIVYEKLTGKLWRKLAIFSLLLSLFSGILGGYIADNFNKEKVIIQQNSNQNYSIQEISLKDAVGESRKSVIEINTIKISYDIFGRRYRANSAGSGVIISDNGIAITNSHVIENAEEILVTDYEGKEYTARVLGQDPDNDIAVIEIDSSEIFQPATLGNSNNIEVGETVFAIGNPLGTLGGSVTGGVISALERDIYLEGRQLTLIQTDATINSGNSGGGLFDSSGSLIGIINAKDSGFTSNGTIIEGIGFAIPINTALEILDDILSSSS